MPDPIAAWRATYTPGNWVVLAGPTSMVVLQPAPARVSDLLNRFWGDVLQSRSIHEVSAQIARHNLSQLASFGLLFWDEAGLHSLTRGALRIVNPDTGEQLASGENVVTWRETALGRDGSVRIEMEPVPADVLQLPLLVGAATASSVFLTTHPDFLVRSTQNLVVPEPSSNSADLPAPMAGSVPVPVVADSQSAAVSGFGVPVVAPAPVAVGTGLLAAGVPLFGDGDGAVGRANDLPGLDEVPAAENSIVDADSLMVADESLAPVDMFVSEGRFSSAGLSQMPEPAEEVAAADELGDFSFAPIEAEAPGASAPAPGLASTAPMSFSIGQQSGLISAVVCTQGHPNPVGSQACRQCQGPVGQIPRLVPRPVVAVVRSNFGVSLDLSSPIFIGRAPDTQGDPGAQVIKVPSPSTDISRSHLRVAPNDWQVEVTDLNSTNGSTITLPGQPPVRLEPGIPTSVPLGTSVDLGDGVQISVELPN